MNLKAFEVQLQRTAFIELIVTLIILGIFFWLMYWVTKSAIRDAIKESGLISAIRSTKNPQDTKPMTLEDIRW